MNYTTYAESIARALAANEARQKKVAEKFPDSPLVANMMAASAELHKALKVALDECGPSLGLDVPGLNSLGGNK